MPPPEPLIRRNSPIYARRLAWLGRWRGPPAAASTGWREPRCPNCDEQRTTGRLSGSAWIGLQRRHDHVVTGIAALELLPGWLSLPMMLGLLVLAWRREGR